jgi:hypothetical protein
MVKLDDLITLTLILVVLTDIDLCAPPAGNVV